jgi:dihydrofolate reductase
MTTEPHPDPVEGPQSLPHPEPVEGPEIVAIAAVARNGVIGAGPEIPWRIAGDQARFKKLSLGHVLIMGRKTYDSIGRPLPGRTTIVITRNADWVPLAASGQPVEGVEVAGSLDQAIDRARSFDPDGPIFIAGGGDIYRAALEVTDRLEITEVDLEPEGDATFPTIDSAQWSETAREDREGFSWVRYERTR